MKKFLSEKNEKQKKCCFVTGGSGFIGSHLIFQLIESKIFSKIICFIYTYEPMINIHHLQKIIKNGDGIDIDVVIKRGDICKEKEVKESIPKDCDCVFHIAGLVDLKKNEKNGNEVQRSVNIGGTKNVVNGCIEKGVKRLIHMSSLAVYVCEKDDVVFSEKSKKSEFDNPDVFSYGYTKLYAEKEVMKGYEKGLDVVILQPGFVFGLYDHVGKVSGLLSKVCDDEILIGYGGKGGFCDVKNVAKTCIKAYLKGRSGEEYVIGGRNSSILNFMNIAARLLGKKQYVYCPLWKAKIKVNIHEMYCQCVGKKPLVESNTLFVNYYKAENDSSKAIKEIDYEITNLEESVKEYIEWYISTKK